MNRAARTARRVFRPAGAAVQTYPACGQGCNLVRNLSWGLPPRGRRRSIVRICTAERIAAVLRAGVRAFAPTVAAHGPARRRPPAYLAVRTLSLLLLLPLLWGLTACAPHRPAAGRGTAPVAQSGLPRVDPGYLQWLERQSFLGSVPALTGQVSGTDRVWRNSATARRLPLLLTAAPNWLDVNPFTLYAGQPLLRALALQDVPRFMVQAGLDGLFLAPSGERGDIWTDGAPIAPDRYALPGENTTSLQFDPVLGADEDFARLAGQLDALHVQLGGELPPAATGLGPDFILQARHASRFDGLYAMIAVPRKDWDVLPVTGGEWDCLPLRPQAVQTLQQRGVLPDVLGRDGLGWTTPGGWAVTGEVRGADGQPRRWAYRYHGHVLRPVLLWQDPSGQARRVFSAAVIRHTGLQGQALAGLRLEALMGLDVGPVEKNAAPDAPAPQGTSAAAGMAPAEAPTSGSPALSPGPEALDALSREIHRYGGWAMLDDALPAALTSRLQGTAVDVTRDAATTAGAACALLTGDAAPLAALLREALHAGADCSRQARGLHEALRVDLRALPDSPQFTAWKRLARQKVGAAAEAPYLDASLAGLATRALGRPPSADAAAQKQVPLSGAGHSATARTVPARSEAAVSGKDGSATGQADAALARAALLLLSWRAGLPGLTFVSPQDLTGALVFPGSRALTGDAARTAPLWEERATVRPGLPLAFGPLPHQWAEAGSFARQAARLLTARRAAGLAAGKALAVISGPPGCLAVLSALPSGGYWLLTANFSDHGQRFVCTLPAAASGTAQDLDGRAVVRQGRALEVDLDAREARHILVGVTYKTQGATP